MAEYERLQEILGQNRLVCRLALCREYDRSRIAQFYQTIRERTNAIGADLLFFTLEIGRIEDDALDEKLKAPELARYAPWFRDERAFKPHLLSDEVEQLLFEKYVVGRAAWTRLYDETMAALRFPFRDSALTLTEVLNLMEDKDRATRQEAAECVTKTLDGVKSTVALITNTLAKDLEIEDRWRRFPRPISSRKPVQHGRGRGGGRADRRGEESLSPSQPSLLRAEGQVAGPRPPGVLGSPGAAAGCRRAPHSWDQARGMVLDAYRSFSPRMAEIGARSSTSAGSTPRPGRARRRAPSPIRPCRVRIPISWSISWAGRAT